MRKAFGLQYGSRPPDNIFMKKQTILLLEGYVKKEGNNKEFVRINKLPRTAKKLQPF